jgi:hypothetical protein
VQVPKEFSNRADTRHTTPDHPTLATDEKDKGKNQTMDLDKNDDYANLGVLNAAKQDAKQALGVDKDESIVDKAIKVGREAKDAVKGAFKSDSK